MSDSRLKINKCRADGVLTKEFFEEYYIHKMLSFPEICRLIQQKWEISLDIKSVWARAKKHGIVARTKSEANTVRSTCDYSKTYMTEQMLEAVDGFLLGDGGIKPTKTCAAFSCSVQYEEFCNYLMSFFECYQPTVKPYTVKDKRIKSGETKGFLGRTKYHPDIWKQYQRWYPSGQKRVPQDVRLTPLSMLLWYLGDGSLRIRSNQIGEVTICTDSFQPDNITDVLITNLRKYNIHPKLNNDNRLHLYSQNIIPLFKLIGIRAFIEGICQ